MKFDIGLLVLRVMAGGMMLFGHGWGKLMNFSVVAQRFPNPLGLGPQLSLGLAVFAEFACALAVMIGFKTRLASIPLVITMLVAGLIVHAPDPWAMKELAFLYASVFLTLFFTDGGRFSADAFIKAKR